MWHGLGAYWRFIQIKGGLLRVSSLKIFCEVNVIKIIVIKIVYNSKNSNYSNNRNSYSNNGNKIVIIVKRVIIVQIVYKMYFLLFCS